MAQTQNRAYHKGHPLRIQTSSSRGFEADASTDQPAWPPMKQNERPTSWPFDRSAALLGMPSVQDHNSDRTSPEPSHRIIDASGPLAKVKMVPASKAVNFAYSLVYRGAGGRTQHRGPIVIIALYMRAHTYSLTLGL